MALCVTLGSLLENLCSIDILKVKKSTSSFCDEMLQLDHMYAFSLRMNSLYSDQTKFSQAESYVSLKCNGM